MWIVGAVVVLGALVYFLKPSGPAVEQPAGTPPALTTQQTSPIPAPTVTTGNALVVAEHQLSGSKLTIASVSLSTPGFVAIAASSVTNEITQPGMILAASRLLPKGTSLNVSITVSTSPNLKYFALLRRDSGNNIFNAQEDPAITGANGAPIMALITTDAAAVTSAKTVYVNLKNFAFAPQTMKVNKGDIVIFTNDDAANHTVTASAFGGRHVLTTGQSYTLSTASLARGTYPYHCDFHPMMTGTLVIQ